MGNTQRPKRRLLTQLHQTTAFVEGHLALPESLDAPLGKVRAINDRIGDERTPAKPERALCVDFGRGDDLSDCKVSCIFCCRSISRFWLF